MNKKELVNKIAAVTGKSKVESKFMLDSIVDIIENVVKEGDEVILPGHFSVKKELRPARSGRNPQTGEVIEIAEKYIPKFKFSSTFKKFIAEE